MRHYLWLFFIFVVAGCQSASIPLGETGAHSDSDSASVARSSHAAPLLRSSGPIEVDYKVTADWGSGFGAELTLTNHGPETLENWSVSFDYPYSIDSIWNATKVASGSRYEFQPAAWNGDLKPGQTITVGWNGSPGNASLAPTNVSVEGKGIEVPPPPEPDPTPVPAPDPTPQPTPELPVTEDGVGITYETTSDWGSGFGGRIVVTNKSGHDIEGWSLKFDLKADISSIWNVTITEQQDETFTVQPAPWQVTIPDGGSVSFGFNAAPGNLSEGAHNIALTTASLPSPDPTPNPDPEPSPNPQPDPDPTPNPQPVPEPGHLRVVGYFPEWGIYARNYNVTDIPAEHLTAVIYAFADVSSSGEVALFDPWAATDKAFPGDTWNQPVRGNFNQLRILKEQHPHLKVLIAIGGWTLSGRFSDVALTPASRDIFATSAADFIEEYGFDGVDIDWEYPVAGGLGSNVYRPEDKQNYTLLLQALRQELDSRGDYILTAALPAGPDKIVNHELEAIARELDWINLMTYDLHGSWDSQTGHQAGLKHNPASGSDPRLNVEWAVDTYLKAGVPAEKIVLGVPSYGLSWANTSGMFQSAAGTPAGTYDSTGIFDYKDIVGRLREQSGDYQRFWDAVALAPWVYAPGLSGGSVITYEDSESLAHKLNMIHELGLGGAMMWELSSDLPVNDVESLLRRISVATE